MSSPCLSGGCRTYGFDLERVKSPSTSTRTSHSSSPSSTLSESSNSPLTISTRKSRTPRKRPNQTYNEAAALLSSAYPSIFSIKHLTKNPCKFTKPHSTLLLDEPPDLLLPFRVFDNSGFLLPQQPFREKPSLLYEPKVEDLIRTSCDKSSAEVDTHGNNSMGESVYHLEEEDDFDAESILDEEIEEGIDSIMGNLSVRNETVRDAGSGLLNYWHGNPMGLPFGGTGIGVRREVRAFRQHVDEGNWWHFPIVDMLQISPRLNNNNNNNHKPKSANGNSSSDPKPKLKSNPTNKKKKKVEKPPALEPKKPSELPPEEDSIKESLVQEPSSRGLLLKLNYDDVLSAWSDRPLPFPKETPGSERNDSSARLAQIDLFSENGGLREASVLRYKEKRRSRLFSNSKKIRYQVRKINADLRPRMKGRFVRKANTSRSNPDGKKKKSVNL